MNVYAFLVPFVVVVAVILIVVIVHCGGVT